MHANLVLAVTMSKVLGTTPATGLATEVRAQCRLRRDDFAGAKKDFEDLATTAAIHKVGSFAQSSQSCVHFLTNTYKLVRQVSVHEVVGCTRSTESRIFCDSALQPCLKLRRSTMPVSTC